MNNTINGGSNSASKFRILSFNPNSIGKNPKRRKVLHALNKKNPDFIIIVDSRICKSIENTIKEEWGGQCLFNSFTSQSRGVALFIKKNSIAKILDKMCDPNGNILATLIEYEGRRVLLQGIYGPNEDNPRFFEEAFQKIDAWQPEFSIFTGDFNVSLNPEADNKNYVSDNNPLARRALKNKMQEHNLIDIWRELNPNGRKFTWKKFGERKFARLDYFLVSASLLPYVQNTEIFVGNFSDHSIICLDIDFAKFNRGRGFWKFNNSLVKDPIYVALIKNTIKKTCCQYATINNDNNFYTNVSNENLNEFLEAQTPESLQALNFNINPQLILDILLLEIRKETIKYSASKKKERIFRELLLNHEIEALETEILASNEHNFAEINNKLQTKKEDLEEIYSYQAQGAFIRARARYKVEGEKPTRLFCALERNNGVQKYIPKLNIEKDGKTVAITKQDEIESAVLDNYSDLFENKDNQSQNNTIKNFLGDESYNSCPKLSQTQKNRMEGEINIEELTRCLKKSKNNVAPGTSGFSNEFFKFFFRDLKILLVNSINYSFQHGMLSITQRLGIITLIPKGDKDKTFIKNWRPLTLLNSIYKLISSIIAERIKPTLDTIINGDQKGFVSERYIGEAIRTTYDIIQWAKDNNKVALILLIDFEKAYDTISFAYIQKCLNFFNFGDNIIAWINLLLQNFSAVINHCGNISKSFNISRGCRQGDPIASYLFIICIEVLAHKLRTKVKGFKIGDVEHVLELYADDCSIFLCPTEENLRKAVYILNDFHKLSGLKISVSKTKAIWFGAKPDYTRKLCPDLPLNWDREFRLLGIDFDGELINMGRNFESKLEEIEKMLNSWTYRQISPYGKIAIIKSLALSKISHLALVIPTLSKIYLKKIEQILFKFLWSGKPDKVSRDHSKLSEKAGGLGMVDIKNFWTALKFSWLRRLVSTSAFWPKILINSINQINNSDKNLSEIMSLGPTKLQTIGKKFKNQFWKEVFVSIIAVMQGAIFSFPEKILLSPFWDNPAITRNNKPIKEATFPMLYPKIQFLSDFFKPGTNILFTKQELELRHDLTIGLELYIELRFIINSAFQRLGLNSGKIPILEYPQQPILINVATMCKKGCGTYYKMLNKKKCLSSIMTERETRWNTELGANFGPLFWVASYAFTTSIKNDNRLKWQHYQIVRNSQFTNKKVNKFNPNVSPQCSYCGLEPELISHLYFNCNNVKNLWLEIKAWLSGLNIDLPLVISSILFGIKKESYDSLLNFIILTAKQFIWATKFNFNTLSFQAFKNVLKHKLEELKYSYDYIEKPELFTPWVNVYNNVVL